MGIIILPFLIGAIVIVIKSVITIVAQHNADNLYMLDWLFGILLSATIFGLIILSYKVKENSYALSPIFRFPSYMIYVPFLLISLLGRLFNLELPHLSNSVSISIIVSGLIIIIFNKYVFNIIENIGRKKYY